MRRKTIISTDVVIFEYKGKKVWYSTEGEGSPVIFLHGWGCDHKIFSSFFGDFVSKFKVVSLDFPGFGESEEPDAVWGVEDYCSFLENFCSELELSVPSFVAHSFGGRVAILFASRNAVSRIVLTDSAGIKPRRGIRYHLKVYSYKLAKFFILKVLKNNSAFEKFRNGKGSSDYASASPKMKAILSKVVNEDLTSVMPSIKAPTLLFWGTEDTATPISDAVRMEKLIPDAGLVKVEGGSHFSFLEAPGLYRSVLSNFFGL